MRITRSLPAIALLCSATATSTPALAQRAVAPISIELLRQHLFTIAHDSMGGRSTGSYGNFLTAEYLASHFRDYGLEPAGDDGTFFQLLPFSRTALDTASSLWTGDERLQLIRDVIPVRGRVDWDATGVTPVYGGIVSDTATWLAPSDASNRMVLFAAGDSEWRQAYRALGMAAGHASLAGAAALGLIILDESRPLFGPRALRDSYVLDEVRTDARPQLLLSQAAAVKLLGTKVASASAGATGPALRGMIRYRRAPLDSPARNVVAVLRGSDPAINQTYIAVTAHNDHVGTSSRPVDHDSLFAHNRVVRPLGADSRNRQATTEEADRIQAIRDSLAALRPSRSDSIFNGADDDGSGTVALVEVARVLSEGPRPRRSVLFVSHVSEEIGLVGSEWFTDHPTVSRDSIIGEIDMDMVGRGPGDDNPEYIEVIGSRRLSTEFGDILEQVNTDMHDPFVFNYEYDAPGHPFQYYCRVDAYSYARYGIPVISIARGSHPDYHQLTDEPQYIDYGGLARVSGLVRDFLLAIGNLEHRPLIDGPVGNPGDRCVQ